MNEAMSEAVISSFLQAGLWCVIQITILTLIAMLVLWPLGWLKRPVGSGPALSAIGMVGVLTLLCFAPLPGWWNSLARRDVADAKTEEKPIESAAAVVSGEPATAPSSAAPSPAAPKNASQVDASINWSDVFTKAMDATTLEPAPQAAWWSWRGAFLVVLCGSLLLGGISLLASLLGLWRLRRSGVVIDRGMLREQLDVLQAQASCARRIEIRESELVGGPATFGHFAPVILMPPSWRSWSEAQLCAVLAHELAHIQRGDYLSNLFSQLCLAAHFYHPLMHALVGRMRLDQELAADALAASWAGPRESYLRALAEVALALPPRSSGLAVRSFVPSRGAWVRRIEMLKSMRGESSARARGWPLAGLLVMGVIAAAVSTLRGSPGVSLAQEPAPGAVSKAAPSADSLAKYVPSNADVVAVVRPGQVFNSAFGKIFSAWADGPSPILAMKKETGLDPAKFEQIVLAGVIGSSPRPVGVVVAQYSEADKIQPLLPKSKPLGDVGGVSLFGLPEEGLVWGAIDGKTVIFGSVFEVTKSLSGGKGSPLLERKAWGLVKNAPVSVIVKSEAIRAAHKAPAESTVHTPQAELQRMLMFFGVAAPYWEETDALAAQLQVEKEISLNIVTESGSEGQAQEVAATATALATLGKNFLKTLQESNQLKQPVHIMLTDAARETLGKVKATASGNSTSVTLLLADQEKVAAVLPALISNARLEAQRMTSMNNMKQIMLALHNYHSAFGKLPPAILYGPDGKTPYSWRVAILPFIEQDALYRQYKFDEPWDSENNKKVLAQVPRTYQDPSEVGKSTNTSYFAVAGVKTIINLGTAGADFVNITDGTSNTIAVVDAKKDTPWTKPEDIDVDTAAAKLGYQDDQFLAGFGDGSVRMIKKSIDATMLKWLFIRDDGNVVTIP